jgi:hypothetical protein
MTDFAAPGYCLPAVPRRTPTPYRGVGCGNCGAPPAAPCRAPPLQVRQFSRAALGSTSQRLALWLQRFGTVNNEHQMLVLVNSFENTCKIDNLGSQGNNRATTEETSC